MRLVCLILVLAFVVVPVVPSHAQSTTDQSQTQRLIAERDALLEALEAASEHVLRLQSEVGQQTINPSVLAAYHQAQIDHYAFEQGLRQHTVTVLQWQLFAAYLVLFLVLGVTVLGVYLSYKEVLHSLTPNTKAEPLTAADESAEKPKAKPATELDLTLTSMKITSAIAGIVILVLSLGFLYLFLDRVFEVQPHHLSSLTEQVEPDDDDSSQ